MLPELKLFFLELSEQLVRRFGSEINSMMVFGSSTSSSWVRGVSDVDIIVVTRGKEICSLVESFMNRAILDLDSKMDLGLRKACTSYRTSKNPIMRLLIQIGDFLNFGKPFYVIARSQIDFHKAKIHDPRIRIITTVFDPFYAFAAKIQQTGRTIFGEDLVVKLKVRPSLTARLMCLLPPLWLIVSALILIPLDREASRTLGSKAVLWACDDFTLALGLPLRSPDQNARALAKLARSRSLMSIPLAVISERTDKPSLPAVMPLGLKASFLLKLYGNLPRLAVRASRARQFWDAKA